MTTMKRTNNKGNRFDTSFIDEDYFVSISLFFLYCSQIKNIHYCRDKSDSGSIIIKSRDKIDYPEMGVNNQVERKSR